MSRSQSPTPPSPTFSSSSSLSPHHAFGSRAQRSRAGPGNAVASSSGPVRSDSPSGAERPPFRPENVYENGELLTRRYSSTSRQDSFDPNASQMSLYDFRRSALSFHWENSTDSYKAIGNDDMWPLQHVGQLGNQQRQKAIVWASKVSESKHGFEDTVADKIVKYGTSEEKRAAQIEVRNLKRLCHNHIVAFLGYYTKGRHLGILMFPVAAWDLDQFLQLYAGVEQRREMIRPWFGCLARVLLYLHKRRRPFKHRDIKPANILIDRSGAVFLTDFGISKEYPSFQATVTRGDGRFTVKYASPQMVQVSGEQGVESDVFSLGCVFLEMATVLLGKELDEMYQYISNRTGRLEIEYHRDFEQFSMWADELRTSVLSRQYHKDWELHLVEQGLPMFLRMVNESCNVEKTIELEEVCMIVDPISPERCHACRQKAVPETIAEGSSLSPEEEASKPIVDDSFDYATNLRESHRAPGSSAHHNLRQPEAVSRSLVPATVKIPSGTVLHNPVDSPGEVNSPPSIVLQRQASNLSAYDESVGHRSVPVQAQQLESITEGSLISVSDPVRSIASRTPSGSSKIQTNPNIRKSARPPRHRQGNVHSKSTLEEGPEPQSSTISRRSTERISVSSTNSRIRMVDNRRTRSRVISFDDTRNIPGTEVLIFNDRRWQVVKKSQISLREGCLWRLPRGFKNKYKTPEGYFYPWDLSASKNVKRIFGKSMLTMFIPGRMTAAQLQAFCSHQDGEISGDD